MSEPVTHETDAHETARPRASTQTLVAGILAALGALMVITGSVLPWVSGTGWIYGRAQSSDTVTLGLRQGLEGGDAWVSLVLGLIACVSIVVLWRRQTLRSRLVTAGTGLIAALWAAGSLTSLPAPVDPGVGLALVIIGGILLGAGGVAWPRDRDAEWNRRVERAMRLWDRGRYPDALALEQRLLIDEVRQNGWGHAAAFGAMTLAWMHADLGRRPQVELLVNELYAKAGGALHSESRKLLDSYHNDVYQRLYLREGQTQKPLGDGDQLGEVIVR